MSVRIRWRCSPDVLLPRPFCEMGVVVRVIESSGLHLVLIAIVRKRCPLCLLCAKGNLHRAVMSSASVCLSVGTADEAVSSECDSSVEVIQLVHIPSLSLQNACTSSRTFLSLVSRVT